jgi:hypothetical protein
MTRVDSMIYELTRQLNDYDKKPSQILSRVLKRKAKTWGKCTVNISSITMDSNNELTILLLKNYNELQR